MKLQNQLPVKEGTSGEEQGVKEESVFRSITAALLVAASSISVYHRHKAELGDSQEELSPSWTEEGLPTFVALRLSGLVLVLSVLTYIINPRLIRWSNVDLPTWMRWSGAGLATASLPLSYWVFTTIGRNITPTVSTRKDHKLVTSGPYRWVRHPLYTTGSLFFVSLSLLAANWFTGLTSISVLVMLLVRLPKEEAKLIEQFGDEYREYMRQTGRLLPRLEEGVK